MKSSGWSRRASTNIPVEFYALDRNMYIYESKVPSDQDAEPVVIAVLLQIVGLLLVLITNCHNCNQAYKNAHML